MSSEVSPATRADQDAAWETCRVLVPLEEISYVVAILEGYENHFLVRTETKGLGFLRIWYPRIHRPVLDCVLREMKTEFRLDVLDFREGMDALDEVFPD